MLVFWKTLRSYLTNDPRRKNYEQIIQIQLSLSQNILQKSLDNLQGIFCGYPKGKIIWAGDEIITS